MQNLLDKVILGTVQFGMPYGVNNSLGLPSSEEVSSILNAALEGGVSKLDTSNLYGSSQARIAAFPKKNNFAIYSKFSLADADFLVNLKATLTELGVSKIAGYSFHRYADFLSFKDWHLIEQACAENLVGRVGVSVYSLEEMERASNCEFVDLIQFPFNIFDNYSLRGKAIEYAISKGKALHARSVFLQGLFFMQPEKFTGNLLEFSEPLQRVATLAKDFNLSLRDLCFAYALGQKHIEGILVGVDSLTHIQDNLVALRNLKIPIEIFPAVDKVRIACPQLLNPLAWRP